MAAPNATAYSTPWTRRSSTGVPLSRCEETQAAAPMGTKAVDR